MPDSTDASEPPISCRTLFGVFTATTLQGFGGVMPILQRELVVRRQWFTALEYAQMLAVARVLPGANVVNMALMVGDRFFGLRGAFSAMAGMLLAPLIIVLLLASLYAHSAQNLLVGRVLHGVGAVSAGLVIGSAFKLLPALRDTPLGLGWGSAIVVASFTLVTIWHVPLWGVLLGPGVLGIAWTWWRLRKT